MLNSLYTHKVLRPSLLSLRQIRGERRGTPHWCTSHIYCWRCKGQFLGSFCLNRVVKRRVYCDSVGTQDGSLLLASWKKQDVRKVHSLCWLWRRDSNRSLSRQYAYSLCGEDLINSPIYRGVIQLVECVVWDHDAAGSSPVTPTNSPPLNIRTLNIEVKQPYGYPPLMWVWMAASTSGISHQPFTLESRVRIP